jgi:holo-[acyl-carrier protein] synthase
VAILAGRYNEKMSRPRSPRPSEPSQNVGIGVDIIDIARFKKMNRRSDGSFFNRFFTKGELRYCFSKTAPAAHLAARFAAKEATVKALAPFNICVRDWRMIEVSRQKSGAPELILPPHLGVSAQVSLSHARNTAVAVVIIFRHLV